MIGAYGIRALVGLEDFGEAGAQWPHVGGRQSNLGMPAMRHAHATSMVGQRVDFETPALIAESTKVRFVMATDRLELARSRDFLIRPR
jgi:hypothetical protein